MIYHILNGDSTLAIWNKNTFEGKPIVFREMLVEGNCNQKLFSEDFFESRRQFFEQDYGITSKEYNEFTYEELKKIQSLEDIEEIILWFENDLFCQINLMAVLSYFSNIDHKITLIKVEKNKGLGEYKIEDYPKLFEDRITLQKNDLEYANKFWNKYTHQKLEDFIPFMHQHSSSFSYLEESVQAHVERFPSPNSGINKMERRILKFLNDEPMSERKLIGKLLRRQKWEGFGDLQYEKMIRDITNDLIMEVEGKYQLTPNGEQILRGTLKYDDSHLPYTYLGGVKRSDYFFDPTNNLVIERK